MMMSFYLILGVSCICIDKGVALRTTSISIGSRLMKAPGLHNLNKVPLIKSRCVRSTHLYQSDEEEETVNVYTTKQVLKEETEAPFRKVRLFLYFALIGAAGIGSVIGITKLLAVMAGARSEDMQTLLTNLGINLGGIPILLYLYNRDISAQNSRLERIRKGGSLAGLKVKIGSKESPQVVKLSDLRRDRGIEKRVVIVAATKDLLESSLLSSVKEADNILSNDLLIIPLVLSSTPDSESLVVSAPSLDTMLKDVPPENQLHIGIAIALPAWQSVIKDEIAKQQKEARSKGVTIVVKKNGKVGSRRFGVPIWETLVEDVRNRKEAGLDITNI
eukprot:gene12821-27034_t